MKTKKKVDIGMILLNFFLISTFTMIFINLLKPVSHNTKMVIVYIWVIEFIVLSVYCCVFYDAKQAMNKRRRSMI